MMVSSSGSPGTSHWTNTGSLLLSAGGAASSAVDASTASQHARQDQSQYSPCHASSSLLFGRRLFGARREPDLTILDQHVEPHVAPDLGLELGPFGRVSTRTSPGPPRPRRPCALGSDVPIVQADGIPDGLRRPPRAFGGAADAAARSRTAVIECGSAFLSLAQHPFPIGRVAHEPVLQLLETKALDAAAVRLSAEQPQATSKTIAIGLAAAPSGHRAKNRSQSRISFSMAFPRSPTARSDSSRPPDTMQAVRSPLRRIPAVHRLVDQPGLRDAIEVHGRSTVIDACRAAIDELRRRITRRTSSRKPPWRRRAPGWRMTSTDSPFPRPARLSGGDQRDRGADPHQPRPRAPSRQRKPAP